MTFLDKLVNYARQIIKKYGQLTTKTLALAPILLFQAL